MGGNTSLLLIWHVSFDFRLLELILILFWLIYRTVALESCTLVTCGKKWSGTKYGVTLAKNRGLKHSLKYQDRNRKSCNLTPKT